MFKVVKAACRRVPSPKGNSNSPDFNTNFPSKVFHLKNSVLGLMGIQGISWKVSVTHTYMNKNEEQPGGFARRIFMIERLLNS